MLCILRYIHHVGSVTHTFLYYVHVCMYFISKILLISDDHPTSSNSPTSLSNRFYNHALLQSGHPQTDQTNIITQECDSSQIAYNSQCTTHTAFSMMHNDDLTFPRIAATTSILSRVNSALIYQPVRTYSSDSGNNIPPTDHPILSEDPDQNKEDYYANYYKLVHNFSLPHIGAPSGEMHDAQAEGNQASNLTHTDSQGKASMVDVGDKPITRRIAIASAQIHLGQTAFHLVRDNKMKKGDVLTVAQIAGVMAAKTTSQLIPLCHPLSINKVDVRLELDEKKFGVDIECEVHTEGKTGVEMEALTGVSVAALTVYDMCKAVTRDMVISGVRLRHKSGGMRGDYNG